MHQVTQKSKVVGLILAAAMLLSACGGGSSSSEPTATTAPAAAAATDTPAPAAATDTPAAAEATNTPEAAAAPAAGDIQIGLITKTEVNPFFVKMKEGAEAEATAKGVKLLTAAGNFDGDNETQVTAIENMINAGVNGILITANDSTAIVPTVKKRVTPAWWSLRWIRRWTRRMRPMRSLPPTTPRPAN
ncbi:MAG: substrate-binding domain-containing protein [Caldilineaceae bacterium]